MEKSCVGLRCDRVRLWANGAWRTAAYGCTPRGARPGTCRGPQLRAGRRASAAPRQIRWIGGLVEWWIRGFVDSWSGGVVEWWIGGLVGWWIGGMVDWRIGVIVLQHTTCWEVGGFLTMFRGSLVSSLHFLMVLFRGASMHCSEYVAAQHRAARSGRPGLPTP